MGGGADLRVWVEGLVIVIWPHSLVAHCVRGTRHANVSPFGMRMATAAASRFGFWVEGVGFKSVGMRRCWCAQRP